MPSLRPLTKHIGTEVLDLDLSKPLPAGAFDMIHQALVETCVLVIRGQRLDPVSQVAFTRLFGEPLVYTRSQNALRDHPHVLVLSNIKEDGRLLGSPASGRYWHSDGHFLKEPPAISILHGIEVPPSGGETWFASMQAAYDFLPQETKAKLHGLRVIISRVQSRPYNYPQKPPVTPEERAAWPDMPQPLVRTHPVTGRKALYIGGNVPWRIEGMAQEESAPLITGLQHFSIADHFVYIHHWQAGDVVIWDNRNSIHRATAYDETAHRRHMHRTTVMGDRPS
jgi:alpha-ketoglutarate-dependent taurine dioxygenase